MTFEEFRRRFGPGHLEDHLMPGNVVADGGFGPCLCSSCGSGTICNHAAIIIYPVAGDIDNALYLDLCDHCMRLFLQGRTPDRRTYISD